MWGVCPIWNIWYVEPYDDHTEVWLVDYEGTPIFHHRDFDHDSFAELKPHWILSTDHYLCSECQVWFSRWDDVLGHIAPFEDTFGMRRV